MEESSTTHVVLLQQTMEDEKKERERKGSCQNDRNGIFIFLKIALDMKLHDEWLFVESHLFKSIQELPLFCPFSLIFIISEQSN